MLFDLKILLALVEPHRFFLCISSRLVLELSEKMVGNKPQAWICQTNLEKQQRNIVPKSLKGL